MRDPFGRTTKQGQFNMLFSYIIGEENDYKTVHFWLEKNEMVTSLSFNSEDDPINGEQVKRVNELKEESFKGWGRMLNRSFATNKLPSAEYDIALAGWVVGRFTVVPCPPFARHPCRPFRLAGACADPAMVQMRLFEAAASEGGVYANPTRTRFRACTPP
eukprot:6171374-Amphidinium_carterae.8